MTTQMQLGDDRQHDRLMKGGLILAAFCLFVAAGWLFGFYPMVAHAATMKPMTALAFAALGLAYASFGHPRLGAARGLRAQIGAGVVAFALFALAGELHTAGLPGYMTLLMLLFLGLALAASSATQRVLRRSGEAAAALALLVSAAVAIAHLYLVPQSSPGFGRDGTSLETALAAMFGAMLQLVALRDSMLVQLLRDEGVSGKMVRRQLPLLMFSLPAIGYLRLQGELLGWYETREGLAYMVVLAMAVTALIVVFSARRLLSAERRRREQTTLLESVVEGTADAIFVKDREGRYLAANRVTLGILGIELPALLDRRDADLMPASEAAALRAVDLRVMESGASVRIEERLSHPEGERFFLSTKSPLRSPDGEVTGVIGIAHEITEQKRHEAELEFRSTHDMLTGLANRSLLRDRLSQALASAERHRYVVALVAIDLDSFKRVNEELSYEIGDRLICRVGRCIGDCVRRGDTVARVYGEEFLVILSEVEGRDYVDEVVRRILQAIAEPWHGDGHEVVLSASAGVSLYPEDATSAEELERHAEMAMHRAKELGKGRHEFYRAPVEDAEANAARSVRRLDRERELRQALEQGELVLHYQPKIELENGQIAGAEALIRWQHPQRGLLSPNDFIPLAEDNGLIVPISEWVVAEVCAKAAGWQAAGFDAGPIALNLSGRQLQDASLAERLLGIVEKSGVNAGAIELEVTETSVLRDHEETARILHRFHEQGLRLALDDFGTGYSSLSFLRKFPISCLKIDRSFVRDIHTDPSDAAIARTVIAMAHALKLHAVAEGVETPAQLRYLHHYRCDQIQGWLFSKAVPADEFETMLASAAQLDLEAHGVSQSRRLLLVDDEEGVLQALRRLFRREGYQILTATSGREALAVLGEHEVQVIMCDQRMAGMNGTELLEKVADLYPETIRIMLTGYTELQAVMNAVNRGSIYKFLTKPWDDAALRQHVRDAFVHHEAKYGR